MPETVDTAATAVSKGKIVEALLKLGKAVQKSTIYPDGHPAVPAAVDIFLEAMKASLEDKGSLTLGVACDRLLLEGEAIEPRNANLTWIAQRMYEQGIGAIDFAHTTPEAECVRFVQWLAKPSVVEASADALPNFEGISLTRYDYARVRFGEDPTNDSEIRKDPVRVWLALMSGLAVGDSEFRLTLSDDPEEAARQLCARAAAGEVVATDVASSVIAMGQHLSGLSDAVKEAVKKRIGRFIGGLTQELRSELLRVDPNSSRQKLEFVTEMVDELPDTTVVDILSNLDRTGARVPHQFITLMNKLIGISTRSPGLEDQVGKKLESIGVPQSLLKSDPEKMRGVLEEVLQARIDKNYNPERYQALLESLSMTKVSSVGVIRLPDRYRDPCSPEAVRGHVSDIVLQLLVAKPDAPEATSFVRCLDEDAPRGIDTHRFDQVHRSASAVKSIVTDHPDLPAELLDIAGTYLGSFSKEDRVEKVLGAAVASGTPSPALTGLFQFSGVGAACRAFQKIADLPDGPERRALSDLLISLDAEAFNHAVARLRQEGWGSLRALFPVLQRLAKTRAVELALTFVGNEDPRVRVEAFRILLSDDQRAGQYERYLERALEDDSSRVVGYALSQARLRGGPEVTQILAGFLEKETPDDELHLKAIAILGAFKTPEARDVLIKMLSRRKFAIWVKQVRIVNALEDALVQIGDEVALQAVKSLRRSPLRWLSLILVQGTVEKK